jgi:hypothetical protein
MERISTSVVNFLPRRDHAAWIFGMQGIGNRQALPRITNFLVKCRSEPVIPAGLPNCLVELSYETHNSH